jgi:hypothetical protein
MLVVGQITPNNANVGLANTGSLQVWGGAYISGNTTIGRQATTEQVYVQGNSNLLTYSQNLENAAWFKSTSIVRFGPSANTYAPDGTNTASQLINTTGGVDTGYVDQYVTTANRNTPYTFSSSVKQGSCPFAQINMYVYDGTVNNAQANVNFSTGTVAVAGVNLVNSTFVPVGGGWYRVSITLNSLVHSQIICRLYLRPPGVAGEFGYFWGVQLEPGITPSAYANTSSGNIVKANNNLFVMGNTFVLGGNTSTSNTTGSLIVHGGLGVSGNVFVSNSVSIISESAMNRFAQISGGQAGVTAPGIGTAGGSEAFDIFGSSNSIRFWTAGKMATQVAAMAHVASGVNYIQFAGNTTGGGVVISGQGSDTNVGINITPKGAGSANVTSTAASTSNTTGSLIVGGGVGVSGNIWVGGTNAGANGVYTDVLRYAANGQPWVMGGGGGGGGATLSAVAAATTYYVGLSAGSSGSWTDARVDTANLFYTTANGTLFVTNYNTSSDRNLKDDIITITDGLTTVDKLRGVSFKWKNSGEKSYGIIAQELEEILPDLVSNAGGHKSVNYNALIGFLIEAVKELSDRVDELEKK